MVAAQHRRPLLGHAAHMEDVLRATHVQHGGLVIDLVRVRIRVTVSVRVRIGVRVNVRVRVRIGAQVRIMVRVSASLTRSKLCKSRTSCHSSAHSNR